jgi:uncharacterized protein YbaA (DUF1428 family)
VIIDLRTYTYFPNKFRKFLQGYQDVGFALTSKHLGKTLGVLRSESGIQNRTFQFFMYEDHDHRDRCRKGMIADPAWHEFVKLDADALLQQSNILLRPMEFSPIGGQGTAPPILAQEDTLRVFELLNWKLQPGAIDDAATLLKEGGAAQWDKLSPGVIGYFRSETGFDHQLFRLSAYASGSDRESVYATMRADASFRDLDHRLRKLSTEVDTTLLVPMPYSPLR